MHATAFHFLPAYSANFVLCQVEITTPEGTAAKMPDKRNGKPLPDKKGLKSMKDFLHDFFNPPKFVKPTETKKVLTFSLNVSSHLYRQGGGEKEEEETGSNSNATSADGDK